VNDFYFNISMRTTEEWRAEADAALAALNAFVERGAEPDPIAQRDCVRRISHIPPGFRDLDRARALLSLAREVYRRSDQPLLAIEPAARAVAMARAIQDKELLYDALMMQGSALLALSNVNDAVDCYDEAWTLADKFGSYSKQAAAASNIGSAHEHAGLTNRARAFFTRALELGDEAERKGERSATLDRARGAAWTNIAYCAVQEGAHSNDAVIQGLAAVQHAVHALEQPPDKHACMARAFAELHYVRLLLFAGKSAEARVHVGTARLFAERSGSVRAQIEVAGVDGLCDVVEGLAEIGREKVLRALEKARAIPLSYRTALITMVQACEAAGDPGGALAYHREFVLVVKRAMRERIVKQIRAHIAQASGPDHDDLSADELRIKNQLSGRIVEGGVGDQASSNLEGMAISAEAYHDTTGLHIYRVGSLSRLIAQELGLREDECRLIEVAARLHDIGMVGVPDIITRKRSSLHNEEWDLVKSHTMLGAELLSHSQWRGANLAEEIARSHHERWDGTGYPDGFRGTATPLAARITAVADTLDTLTHPQQYRPAISVAEAIGEIRSESEKQFDPAVVEAFVRVMVRLLQEHGVEYEKVLDAPGHRTPLARSHARVTKPIS
jgi:putative two-component system response regulator